MNMHAAHNRADDANCIATIANRLTIAEQDCLEAAASGRLGRVKNGWSRPGEARRYALSTGANLQSLKLAKLSFKPGFPVLVPTGAGRMVLAIYFDRNQRRNK